MSNDNATLQLPKDMIEAVINQHVGLAIQKSLGDSAYLLDEIVRKVMTEKVNDEGRPSNYSSSVQFVQWAANNAIRNAVINSLNNEIVKYEDVIQKNLIENLQKKNSPLLKKLVEAMTTGMISAASNKWQIKVTIE